MINKIKKYLKDKKELEQKEYEENKKKCEDKAKYRNKLWMESAFCPLTKDNKCNEQCVSFRPSRVYKFDGWHHVYQASCNYF